MRCKHCLGVKIVGMFFVMLMIPLNAGAQEIPLLLSTGLPTVETPEDILPAGAVVYLRANNSHVLLENIDSLLSSFVPEKSLPPELQPIFAGPQPVISFFGMQMFGQPVELSNLPELVGIALDRPVSLAVYPMSPDKGFAISIPVANATVLTGMLQEMLMPERVEEGKIGEVGYHLVTRPFPYMPREIYLLASEDTVYLCGSLGIAQMLVNSGSMGTVVADPVMANAVKKYEDRDLTFIASHRFIKPQLPFFQQQFAQALVPAFQTVRAGLDEIPPTERFMLDARLRLELGIDNVEQLVDFVEAYSSGIYRVVLEKVLELLTNLDGLALALNVEEDYQNLALTLFSTDIQTENCITALPIDELKQALNTLPGLKSVLFAVGQAPEAKTSVFFANVLSAIEEELNKKGLPMEGFLAYKEYYLAKQCYARLESKVPWTIKTVVPKLEKGDFSQFNTLWELLKYTMDRMAAGPFLVTMTLMPSVSDGLIAQYFTEKAEIVTQNEQLYRTMREKLPFRQPWLAHSSRFHQEDVGENVEKLTFENVHTTQRGFFGYQQHELINRRIMFHKTLEDYELLYYAADEVPRIKDELASETQPVPGATLKLLDQAPTGTNALSVFRTLHFVSKILDVLTEVEALIHREMETFMLEAQKIVDDYGKEEFEAKLFESKLDLPLLMASLHLDEQGNVYGMLPGGLHYPRPKVMPKIQELFQDFLAAKTDVGGSISFTAIQPGEFEFSVVQNTEALALLVKTVVNNFYDKYMLPPEGMERLMTEVAHPDDFQDLSEEQIFENPFWKSVLESDEFPLLRSIQRSKQSRTKADMRAIGTALGSYIVDFNFFPLQTEIGEIQNAGLPKDYYWGTFVDGWDSPYMYVSDASGSQYLLVSYGKDQIPGITSSDFDADIVFMNGQFVSPEEDFWYGDREQTLNAALLQAVGENAIDFVQVLLDLGADPNAADEQGLTALSIALEEEFGEMADLLREYGASE